MPKRILVAVGERGALEPVMRHAVELAREGHARLRMLLFYINRAGRQLPAARRAELYRAKRLMQETIDRQRQAS